MAGEFISVMGETVGYKSGLALSRDQFSELLNEQSDVTQYFTLPDNQLFRIRSEVFAEVYYFILDSLGVTPTHLEFSQLLGLRRTEWKEIRDLDDLFKSEQIKAEHGRFFDRRFIDYLRVNFNRIDDIHWRQFEALTAEYFDQLGYVVELGPGRNDEGVDVRLWDKNSNSGGPPLILVQCKRQKAKIEKVVVKALWADILAENAESGLIVTTSSLSPGSGRTLRARGYPIHQADRKTLQRWLEELRSPGAGVFLGE